MIEKDYSDIINLPAPKPKNKIPMSIEKRAAQFAPFAALTGHDDAIKETAKSVTDEASLDYEAVPLDEV